MWTEGKGRSVWTEGKGGYVWTEGKGRSVWTEGKGVGRLSGKVGLCGLTVLRLSNMSVSATDCPESSENHQSTYGTS